MSRVPCGPDRERPTKQCYHTKQVTKKLSFTDVRKIYCTHDSPDVVGMVVGPTTSGDRRGERAAAHPPAVLALALHRHITQHAMSTRRPAGTPNLQRILFHTLASRSAATSSELCALKSTRGATFKLQRLTGAASVGFHVPTPVGNHAPMLVNDWTLALKPRAAVRCVMALSGL